MKVVSNDHVFVAAMKKPHSQGYERKEQAHEAAFIKGPTRFERSSYPYPFITQGLRQGTECGYACFAKLS